MSSEGAEPTESAVEQSKFHRACKRTADTSVLVFLGSLGFLWEISGPNGEFVEHIKPTAILAANVSLGALATFFGATAAASASRRGTEATPASEEWRES